ncbi:penicillin-binding protein 2 [Epidermidibacterium keratini]|uniref:Penicillin-binding protein 2 n=1 Tax=Epidermidibacterium keratini TaxID=1891644 RepID=A0A7L4YI47_9ACTN|nr:penicillin-binding protein 2 [Epidermidibacterium keratini]QHB99144.1 penicillin-binding protein 2 [Epidermidibacterium keratini]
MRSRRRNRRLKLADGSRRMRAAMVVLSLLMLVIGGRLLQLQGLDGAAYAAQGEGTRLRTKVLPAERGQITDRNGTQLAYNVETREIYADPRLIPQDKRAQIAEVLSTELQLPYSDVMLAMMVDGAYSPIASNVEPSVAQKIVTTTIDEQSLNALGIGSNRTQKRIYPSTTTGGQIVGFVGRDGNGLAGIEQSFDAILAGQEGKLVYEASPSGAMIPAGIQQETPAEPGASVQLTINSDLQYLVQNAVDAYQQTSGATATSAVVLDAKSGQVVAMYGTPGYDPTNPGASNPDDLANPAISQVLEPGSINKVTTIGPALDQGIVTPDTVLTVPGSIPVADVIVNDAWVHGNVEFTVTGILAKSSNVGTLMINKKLSKEGFYAALQKFGIGQKTGIELPAESPGILAPRDKWSGSQVGNVPIGQGVSLTPLQMATVYQAIANDGVRIPPRIVESTTEPDGTTKKVATPEPVNVMSASAAEDLRGMLEAVVNEGTGGAGAVPGYRVGGKTGTGQRANPQTGGYAGGGYYHTFVGMAPIEDPKYVVAIAVTDPNVAVQGGAAPLFSTVMGQVLQGAGVPPSSSTAPKYTLTVD